MKIAYTVLFSSLLVTACSIDDIEGGGVVSYHHSSTLPCPAPQSVPSDVAAQLGQAPSNTKLSAFYRHYLKQQNDLAAFRQLPESETNHCPSSFWAPDDVATEFKNYPPGSPMRQFFLNYVAQQRAIDEYYSPKAK